MDNIDLSVNELCDELRLHPNTVRRMINAGALPAYRAGLKSWRVTRRALDDFKASGGPRPIGRPRKENE